MTMRNFADHVIAVSNNENDGITNLQLQKVMYFALGDYIRDNGIDNLVLEIYDEPFEAWPYGPVVRSEYFRNKKYGRFIIQENGVYNISYSVFDDYIKRYILVPVSELVEKSHKHSKWFYNQSKIMLHEKIEYSLEDLANDFA